MPQETRADAVRTERRRKPGSIEHSGMAFVYDEGQLDRKNYAYRTVNDTKGRVRQLESQDWDIAPEDALLGSTSGGTVQSKHAGVNELGSFNGVLMRKPIAMHKEDQAAKQRPIDEMEGRIKAGDLRNDPEMSGEGTYTPNGRNTIERV